MPGLLDNPKDAAMLQLGLGLLSRSGPSRMPVSIGQALGDAGQEAMGTYQQVGQNQQLMQMREMQMQQQRMQAEEMQKRQAALQQFRSQLPPPLQAQFDMDPQGFMQQLKPKAPMIVAPGASLVDPNNGYKPIYTAPKEEAQTSAIKEYQFAVTQGYKGTFEDFIKSRAQAGATTIQNYPAPMAAVNPVTNQTELVQFGNKGVAKPTGFKPALDAKPPTEAESKAAFYAGNMRAASKVLDKLEKEGMDMSKIGSQVDTAIAGGMGNLVASPRAQQARQAQNQWAEQMLRMQTGAAATQDEITRTVATYFPKPGDSADVVKQKKEMRAQAEQGVFAASGRAQSRVPSGGVKFLGFE